VMQNTMSILQQLQLFVGYAEDVDVTLLPLWQKLHMYKVYQLAIVLYFSLDLVCHLGASILLGKLPWMTETMDHALAALLCLVCGYAFWMRPFNPYYYWIVQINSKYQLTDNAEEQQEETERNRQTGRTTTNSRESTTTATRAAAEATSSSADPSPSNQSSSSLISSISSSPSRPSARSTNDLRASLLDEDDRGGHSEATVDGGRVLPSASSSSSSFSLPNPLNWRPCLSPPPVPTDSRTWLLTSEEKESPLLILHNPDDSVTIGQFLSPVTDSPSIPNPAKPYFPQQLIHKLKQQKRQHQTQIRLQQLGDQQGQQPQQDDLEESEAAASVVEDEEEEKKQS